MVNRMGDNVKMVKALSLIEMRVSLTSTGQHPSVERTN